MLFSRVPFTWILLMNWILFRSLRCMHAWWIEYYSVHQDACMIVAWRFSSPTVLWMHSEYCFAYQPAETLEKLENCRILGILECPCHFHHIYWIYLNKPVSWFLFIIMKVWKFVKAIQIILRCWCYENWIIHKVGNFVIKLISYAWICDDQWMRRYWKPCWELLCWSWEICKL